jgi:mRNA interferase HigB
MRVISIKTLREFWAHYPLPKIPLRAWYADVSNTDWITPADIKAGHHNARFLANDRGVFHIKGNDFRLVVAVRYTQSLLFVRVVGTHAEYDRIDASTS